MYESFFGFNSRPFAASPLIENYYPADSIEHARQTLIRVVERAEGPGVAIGQAGLGKSLLCRLLAEYFRDSFDVVLLSSTRIGTRKSLLQAILFELHLPYLEMEEGELRLSLLDFLQPGNSSPNGMLLIVDEADSLPLRLLDEIRMITNLVREGLPRARLIMAGGPRLEERFAHPKLDSFNQRLAARCYLDRLGREDVVRYLHSQIGAVGGEPRSIFTDDAVDAMHRASDGIPRLINQIGDHALVLGCAGGRRYLDGAGIEEAWADLQQLPGPWREEEAQSFDSAGVVEFGELDDPSPVELDFDKPDEANEVPEPVLDLETSDEVDEDVHEDIDAQSSERDPSTGMHLSAGAEIETDFESSPWEGPASGPGSDWTDLEFPQVIIGQQFDNSSYLDEPEAMPSPGEPSREFPSEAAPRRDSEPEMRVSETTVPETSIPETSVPETVWNSQPEAVDPFSAEFEDEEIVLDRSTALAIEAFRDRPAVTSSEGRELAQMLAEQLGQGGEAPTGEPMATALAESQVAATSQDQDEEPSHELQLDLPRADGLLQAQLFDAAAVSRPQGDHEQSPADGGDEGENPHVVFPNSEVDDDRDLMIIEEQVDELGKETKAINEGPAAAERLEYQQLFAQLRKV